MSGQNTLGDDLYFQLGASSSKSGMKAALKAAGSPVGRKHFIQLLPDWADDPEYAAFMHSDGAGTKTIIAYIHYKLNERRGPYVFGSLAQDVVAMNINDVLCAGFPTKMAFSNIVGRNKTKVSDKILGEIFAAYAKLAMQMNELDCPFTLAGGETEDIGALTGTISINGTLAGRMPWDTVVDMMTIRPGDVIIGFSSTGQASYENRINSGIGSNGLTLARNVLIPRHVALQFREIFDTAIDSGEQYFGPSSWESFDAGGMSVLDALSSPTRIFAPVLRDFHTLLRGKFHGIVHCTGGGQTKIGNYGPATGIRYVKDNLFPVPPIFAIIQWCAGVSWREMHQVFNMGHLLEVICPREFAPLFIEVGRKYGIATQQVGYVEETSPDAPTEVKIVTEYGEFTY